MNEYQRAINRLANAKKGNWDSVEGTTSFRKFRISTREQFKHEGLEKIKLITAFFSQY